MIDNLQLEMNFTTSVIIKWHSNLRASTDEHDKLDVLLIEIRKSVV